MSKEYIHEHLKELIVEKALHLCCDPIEQLAKQWAESGTFNQGGLDMSKDQHRYEQYLEEAKEIADEFRHYLTSFLAQK